MFGEYGLYCNDEFFAVICDDQLFVKDIPAGEKAFPDLPKAPPYEGAKDYIWVEDVDDQERMTELTCITCEALRGKPQKNRGNDHALWLQERVQGEFYPPPKRHGIITVPAMNFLAVRGQGGPDGEGGTRLTCTETVTGKRWWMRPLATGYLKRQQKRYLDDFAK